MTKQPTKDELILANQLLEKQLVKKTRAVNLLLEFWDSLPDEEKDKLDKQLKRCGC